METKETRIELTPLELAMLKRDLAGEFFPPEQTDEENKALANYKRKFAQLINHKDNGNERNKN